MSSLAARYRGYALAAIAAYAGGAVIGKSAQVGRR